MLTIIVPSADEYFDESLGENGEFVTPEGTPIELEHSLVSLSKWEMKWEKPFLSAVDKTNDETFSYIEAMLVTPNVPPELLQKLSPANITDVNNYINRKMTATWFSNADDSKKSTETITNELIYYWMIALNIPIECENWHLARLLTLIRVVNQKSSPPKKMGRAEAMQKQRELNAQRRAASGSAG